jgi:hypothetical protein
MFPDVNINGGTHKGIQVVPSDAASSMLLLDASQVGASAGQVTLDAGSHASVEMSDAPTASPTNMVSLWANGLRGLRAERIFGAQLLRNTAAVEITGVTA